MSDNRVIACVDGNFFEIQALNRDDQEIYEKYPCVAAYVKHERIVSVNDKARALGVTRDMKLCQAQRIVENLKVCEVPYPKWWQKWADDKPDRSALNDASFDMFQAITSIRSENKWENLIQIEYGSPDEAFFDITQLVSDFMKKGPTPQINPWKLHNNTWFQLQSKEWFNTYYLWKFLYLVTFLMSFSMVKISPRDYYSALIMTRFISGIKSKTGFKVTAGLGWDRISSKIATELHKVQALNILTKSSFERVAKSLDLAKVSGLKSRKGRVLKQNFGVKYLVDLRKLNKTEISTILFQNFDEMSLTECEKEAWMIKDMAYGKLPSNFGIKRNRPVREYLPDFLVRTRIEKIKKTFKDTCKNYGVEFIDLVILLFTTIIIPLCTFMIAKIFTKKTEQNKSQFRRKKENFIVKRKNYKFDKQRQKPAKSWGTQKLEEILKRLKNLTIFCIFCYCIWAFKIQA